MVEKTEYNITFGKSPIKSHISCKYEKIKDGGFQRCVIYSTLNYKDYLESRFGSIDNAFDTPVDVSSSIRVGDVKFPNLEEAQKWSRTVIEAHNEEIYKEIEPNIRNYINEKILWR